MLSHNLWVVGFTGCQVFEGYKEWGNFFFQKSMEENHLYMVTPAQVSEVSTVRCNPIILQLGINTYSVAGISGGLGWGGREKPPPKNHAKPQSLQFFFSSWIASIELYPPAYSKLRLRSHYVKPLGVFTGNELWLDITASIIILFCQFSLSRSPSHTGQFGLHHLHQWK